MSSLWEHQRHAVEFAQNRAAVLYYMGMGTGKTRVALELANGYKEMTLSVNGLEFTPRTLILAPKAAVTVWAREAEKVGLEVTVLDENPIRQRFFPDEGICVTNYEALLNKDFHDRAVLWAPHVVVADEVHRVKAPTGKLSKALYKLCWKRNGGVYIPRVPLRMGLTGTPLPNSPLDAFGVFRFLDPNVFGTTFGRFRERYAIVNNVNMGFAVPVPIVVGYQNQDDFNDKFYSMTFRADTDDVLDLPAEHHVVREIQLPKRALRLYEDMEKEFVAELAPGQVTIAPNTLVKLLRMRQITSGSLGGETIHREREDMLEEVVDEIGGEPVVVFCQFKADLDSVHHISDRLGMEYGEISGRGSDYHEWLDGGIDILGVQLAAGSEGIDLTRARYAVYYSIGYSLKDYKQSLARLRRPGQERNVTYVHLVARDTIDEVIYGALERKESIVDAILEVKG